MYVTEKDIEERRRAVSRKARATHSRQLELQKQMPCVVYKPSADKSVQETIAAGLAAGVSVHQITAAVAQ
jgi:hypothetical protein